MNTNKQPQIGNNNTKHNKQTTTNHNPQQQRTLPMLSLSSPPSNRVIPVTSAANRTPAPSTFSTVALTSNPCSLNLCKYVCSMSDAGRNPTRCINSPSGIRGFMTGASLSPSAAWRPIPTTYHAALGHASRCAEERCVRVLGVLGVGVLGVGVLGRRGGWVCMRGGGVGVCGRVRGWIIWLWCCIETHTCIYVLNAQKTTQNKQSIQYQAYTHTIHTHTIHTPFSLTHTHTHTIHTLGATEDERAVTMLSMRATDAPIVTALTCECDCSVCVSV